MGGSALLSISLVIQLQSNVRYQKDEVRETRERFASNEPRSFYPTCLRSGGLTQTHMVTLVSLLEGELFVKKDEGMTHDVLLNIKH